MKLYEEPYILIFIDFPKNFFCQKVAKEHMGMFKPHSLEKPHNGVVDPGNVHHLIYMLKARENELFSDLKAKMSSAFVYTKVGKKVAGFGLSSIGSKLQVKVLESVRFRFLRYCCVARLHDC
jgi:hypothetical protein